MTPVIVTGGIDLSVGSLMGLSAVLFGKLWQRCRPADRRWRLPLTLAVGAAAGGLNGLLITRLRIAAADRHAGLVFAVSRPGRGNHRRRATTSPIFPARSLSRPGLLFGGVPAQLPMLVVAAVGFWMLLHRTTIGRGSVAIGFSPEGARYAGIPVERAARAGVSSLSGCRASLAASIYVAHLGQAKADAGTGYELPAITAVVLGGTSIFGGRGSIHGTLLGLFAIAILQNGLRLADLPPELAGILTGRLLLVAIGLDRLARHDATSGRTLVATAARRGIST